MYRIASLQLAKNQESVFLNIPTHEIHTWRDLCQVIGRAEGMMTVDAEMTMHYFAQPPPKTVMSGNPWLLADLEDSMFLTQGETLMVRFNLPTAQFKRRYIIQADKGKRKRQCFIM